MRSVNIRLHDDELKRLVAVALRERRRPAEQAAQFVAERLASGVDDPGPGHGTASPAPAAPSEGDRAG